MFKKMAQELVHLMHQPQRVFWWCLILGFGSLLIEGSLLRLWSLHRDHKRILNQIEVVKSQAKQLDFKIHEAQQPEFIERQVRDQFDLVKEGDLIFIFSEEDEAS